MHEPKSIGRGSFCVFIQQFITFLMEMLSNRHSTWICHKDTLNLITRQNSILASCELTIQWSLNKKIKRGAKAVGRFLFINMIIF